jgi:hypothetical protein
MPEVDATSEQQQLAFEKARKLASEGTGVPGKAAERCVAIVTPGRMVMPIPCPPPGSMSAELVAGICGIIPETDAQAITVIAFNDMIKQRALTPQQANALIPFLGYLIGMAYAGHSVVVFEGHPTALSIACRDVDLLLVDDAMRAHLQSDWASVAAGVMRKPRILVFSRDGRIMHVNANPPE